MISAKFDTCTVVSVNGTLVEAKLCTFALESTHFIFNKCPIYTHDGASAKFSTNSHETDYSLQYYTFSSFATLCLSESDPFKHFYFLLSKSQKHLIKPQLLKNSFRNCYLVLTNFVSGIAKIT